MPGVVFGRISGCGLLSGPDLGADAGIFGDGADLPGGLQEIGEPVAVALLGNALLAHFRPAQRPLSQGKLIAYRVIDAAIQTSSFGVGGDIQMWYVDADGVHQANEDEIIDIRAFVSAWQEEESELLSALAGTPEPESEPAAPLPEPASDATTGLVTVTSEADSA